MWFALLLLIIVIGILAVLIPVLRSPEPWAVAERQRSGPSGATVRLQREKASVLRRIKDLELEKESGATTEAEYEEMRRTYLGEAALLNRRLAELEGRQSPAGSPPPLDPTGGEAPDPAHSETATDGRTS